MSTWDWDAVRSAVRCLPDLLGMSAIVGVAFSRAHNGVTKLHDNDKLRGMD